MSAGTADPPAEAGARGRSPEPGPALRGGISRRRRPTSDLSSTPHSRAAPSGETRVPGLQKPGRAGRRPWGRDRCGAGAQHRAAVSAEQSEDAQVPAHLEGEAARRLLRLSHAVCSAATRGRCVLVLHLGRQGLGCGVTRAHPSCGLEGARRILALGCTLLGGPMVRALRPLGMLQDVTQGT